MDTPEVEQEASLAVKSLRSRFEQLAAGTSSGNSAPSSPRNSILPRPRSSSNSGLNARDPVIQHLRASSSSSDLEKEQLSDAKAAALKRPPPPPPVRSARSSASPTQAPPVQRASPIPPSRSPSNDSGGGTDVAESPPRDVASLRERFNGGPIQKHSSSESFSTSITSKPPVPPRPTLLISRSPDDESSLPHQQPSSSEPGATPLAERPFASNRRKPPSPEPRSKPVLSETDTQDVEVKLQPPRPPPSRPLRPGLPPPPPRHRDSISPSVSSADLCSSTAAPLPPPLPSRRGTTLHESGSPRKPSPTPRPVSRSGILSAPEMSGAAAVLESAAPAPSERRFVGSGKLPPPPTRTIAPGDKLPAPRRAEVSSDDEEVIDDDSPAKGIDSLPDTSSSSRRVPALSFREGFPSPKITFHPHTGCVAASGANIVVAHVHNIKIYNLDVSDAPLFDIEMKQLGMKDTKILCLEFRPSLNKADRGCLIWIGTKDGSILEMDIRVGIITAVKPSAHLHPISHIFRHGRSMITLDESGKVLIFSPDPNNIEKDISLQQTTVRAVRTTDKHDFVKLLDGKLWTASRAEHVTTGGSALSRPLPIIRVYDIFNSASAGKSILPHEHVGQVTTAAMLASQPDKVFVGHEEGYVSAWLLDTPDGWPVCSEVIKVSTSDIVALEGVNDKLWTGSRNGMISVFEVSQRPWTMTNSWNAHPGLPVQKLFVNPRAIETNRKLCVVSLGRDDFIRFWDGLLGVDWVENELVKNEASFSTFQDVTALVVSWNCDAARPDSLLDDRRNAEFFNQVLSTPAAPPDIISFSFQEVIDLESRKMAAKNVLLGGKKKTDDALNDRVTGAYKRWHDRLVGAVKTAYLPLGVEYTAVNTESMVGLFSCLFLRNTKDFTCKEKHIAAIKRGMGGRYGNKGAVIARLVIGDSSLCFVNCHLAAGQNALKQRNADIAAILEEKAIFESSHLEAAYVGGGDGTMVMDHEFVFVNGDLNYRIDLSRRESYVSAFRSGDLSNLLAHDQLLVQMKTNKTFRLRGFSEGPITFLPTYKYDPRSDEYDTSEKRRHPAWCDRILWRSRVPNRVQQLAYQRYEVNVSDHRPISANFVIRVKNIQLDARLRSKAIVEAAWADEQERLLDAAQAFYVRQALL